MTEYLCLLLIKTKLVINLGIVVEACIVGTEVIQYYEFLRLGSCSYFFSRNAVDEVKAVAQMVTANNNEDGIAVALDKLLG